MKPNLPAAHAQNHPGPITNCKDLCSADTSNLVGSGRVEQFEKSCVDMYLLPTVRENFQFKVIN
jgi:hypothetical protein